MTDRHADRFELAVDAVSAAFTVIARHSVSSGALELIDIDHQLRALRPGDEISLRRTLNSLNTLAASPRLFAFRLVTTALAQSLPRSCSVHVTSQDVLTAALDLSRLAHEAESLRAPDVAAKLTGIIDALLEHARATRLPATNESFH